MVHDVVARGALGEIIDCRHVQQHFEIEDRVVLQGTQDVLHMVAFYRDRKVSAKFAHVHEIVRKPLFECSGDIPMNFVILFEEAHNGARWTLKIVDSRVEFGNLKPRLPRMTFIGEPLVVLDLLLKFDHRIQDGFRRRRAAWNVDIDRNDFIDALHHMIRSIKTTACRAGAHRNDPFRLGHLIINLFEDGPHLVVNGAEHH